MTRQKIFVILVINLFLGLNTNGQEKANNLIYYELGGVGYGEVSLNYERNISLNDKVVFAPSLGFSLSSFIHVGGTKSINDNQFFIPLQVNFLFGKKNHHLETGFGMPIAIDNEKFGLVSNIYVLRLGYRYQQKKSGLIFRTSINPAFVGIVPKIIGGISLGYAF